VRDQFTCLASLTNYGALCRRLCRNGHSLPALRALFAREVGRRSAPTLGSGSSASRSTLLKIRNLG
jgi:hypothetical protein